MPTKAGRPCKWGGCPEIVTEGAWCLRHAQEIARQYEGTRPSAARRGYGRDWRRLRALYLRRNPLCCDPWGDHGGRPVVAAEVDHILPIRQGGGNDWDNLQALCKACHSKKTAAESGFGGRGDQISGPSLAETATEASSARPRNRRGGG